MIVSDTLVSFIDRLHFLTSPTSTSFFLRMSDTAIPVRFFFLSEFTVTVQVIVDLSADNSPDLLIDAVDFPELYHVVLSIS